MRQRQVVLCFLSSACLLPWAWRWTPLKHFWGPLASNLSIITSQTISNYLPLPFFLLPPLPPSADTFPSAPLIKTTAHTLIFSNTATIHLFPLSGLFLAKASSHNFATQSHTANDQLSVSTPIVSSPSVFVDQSLFSAGRKAVLQRVLSGNATNTLTHVQAKSRISTKKRTKTGLQSRQLSLHNLIRKVSTTWLQP